MLVRGWSAVVYTSLALVVSEVVQRVIVAPLVWLSPSRRTPILKCWIKFMAWITTRPLSLIGGCVIPRAPRIVPTGPGNLIVMNHQSLFDIPLVVETVKGGYPRIVTRERYTDRWIPVISQMVRLYQYPVLDPTANADVIRQSLDDLARTGAETDLPIAVFPEGTRSKNGDIGCFKKGDLARLLSARGWTVYIFVTDGFWRAAKFQDFVRGLSLVRGKMAHAGTLEWTDPSADPTVFVDEVREMMVASLSAIRAEAAVK